MATTLAAPAAGAVGIAGDPAALFAAADEMSATARDYFNAADAIAAHGRAVTANWVGDASDAAGRHIATLSTRVQVGSEVYTAAATTIRTYAGELAAAQGAWTAASVRAASASTALPQAHQAASAAAAMPTTDTTGQPDPTAQAAQSLATDQAATAVTAASTALSNAQDDMAAAVAAAAAANQRAADAITACCEQLTAMDVTPSTPTTATSAGARGTTTTTGGTWTATGDDPTSRDLLGYAALGLTPVGLLGYALGDHSESPADAARDSLGGFGEAAWDAGPGMIGTLLGLAGKFPGDTGDAEASREITEAHAWLQKWWGADTSSRAYKSEKSAGDVASLFIGGGEARYGLKATEVGVDAIRGTAGAEDATALVRATEANPAEVPAEVSAVGGAPIKAKPPWLQRVQEGDDFHREQQAALKAISPTAATEVHVGQPGRPNTYPYNRVDAYDPITGDIISMKNTQLAGADTEYAKSLIREAAKKYSPGTRIASTPSNATQGLPGGILTGQTVLLLPKQDAPIPEDLLEYALSKQVLIRETE